MRPIDHRSPRPIDAGMPSLLLVSLVTVLAGVVGVIAVAKSTTGVALVGAMVVLLTGLVIVIRTMNHQLDDSDGRQDPEGRPV